ncbi:hypothetical protein HMPREF2594_01535 [Enterococcus sp. HMSC077E04]|uniref:polysaccharide pyruvyl transferase family protein n=1 Tax=unclassified Enterococcus TaxID=2608891 RepID=UPI0008A4014D|nr:MULTISPECIES: polysaccharide pyruvyl transferase family protein [unclassified Enterococcus]OFK37275.1 hypothetical protein HMPREF2827_00740 [Enterococcus sp. HMSC077E07]OFN28045.1 hypothetical protein HMPREF2594_01535 [Enterococcus sp. HMSC077E04]
MKIGIVTIVNGASFGNRLQNYATQKVLENNGYTVETINNCFDKESTLSIVIKNAIYTLFKFIPHFKKSKSIWKRMYTFYQWDKQYIDYSHRKIDASKKNRFVSIKNDYDYFLVGSDQIWNPKYAANKGFELLSFVPNEKRVSLSTSLGVPSIPSDLEKLYVTEWNKFKSISVRENQAAKIIEDLTGTTAAVHIDPTLMLERSEWEAFQKKPDNIDENYILSFFLTNPPKDTVDVLDKVAKDLKIGVLTLDASWEYFQDITPNHFVYLISHARMIYTDSFHCTVFSLLFGKPVVVFDRFDSEKMNSRLSTLLNKVNKAHFWVGKKADEAMIRAIASEPEYDIDKLMVSERECVKAYLKEYLQ